MMENIKDHKTTGIVTTSEIEITTVTTVIEEVIGKKNGSDGKIRNFKFNNNNNNNNDHVYPIYGGRKVSECTLIKNERR